MKFRGRRLISSAPGAVGTSTLNFSPNIDALPQRVAPVLAHLLAAIPLAVRQNEYSFDAEAEAFGDVREDEVNGDARAGVTNIVVDHDERSATLQHASALVDGASHFVKISAHHTRDAVDLILS